MHPDRLYISPYDGSAWTQASLSKTSTAATETTYTQPPPLFSVFSPIPQEPTLLLTVSEPTDSVESKVRQLINALRPNSPSTSGSSRTASPASAAPSSGRFVCTWPGCTAPAFATQFLLSSHANVHSSGRPHHCPVPGCSRGLEGRGFRRKNELIRHGLVHDSPGYVCPFCPDSEHKYPRPDNLQRYVPTAITKPLR